MKYGETLRQRSVPQWAYQNVDYDAIKRLIKEYTTPGKSKAISIPGQGGEAEVDFENALFEILVDQHDRIGLFVKSKSGEIDRRLDHLGKQLHNLELSSWPPSRTQGRVPNSRLAKYSKIEDQAIQVGEEIKLLSRFISAQRTAFTKLLKKYTKWTKRDILAVRFNIEVLEKPQSFVHSDLTLHLDLWTSLLNGVRVAMGQGDSSATSSPAILPMVPKQASAAVSKRINEAMRSTSDLEFDTVFTYSPLGSEGTRAVYWVHPEQLVEVQVLLLQHTRSVFSRPPTSSGSQITPSVTRRSSLSRRDSAFDKQPDHGVIVIDDGDRFAQKQNSIPLVDAEEAYSRPLTQPAATVMWTSNNEAIMCIAENFTKSTEGGFETATRIKKKHLGGLLDLQKPFNPSSSGTSTPVSAQPSSSSSNAEATRTWLRKHPQVSPLTAIIAKRGRFASLPATRDHGQWCTLDTDISLKRAVLGELEGKEWPQRLLSDSIKFPYAVLEVRQEGRNEMDLIKILDESHLTERVRGFSLAVHALWTCCRPRTMTPPFWLQVLESDIRKLPTDDRKRNRKLTSRPPTRQGSIQETEDFTNSTTAVSLAGDSSMTSTTYESQGFSRARGIQNKSGQMSPKRKKRGSIEPKPMRYWSEYDNPEEEDDGGYYIYIDPDAEESMIPFKKTFTGLYNRIKGIFVKSNQDTASKNPEFDPLLPHDVLPKPPPTESSLDSDTESSSDDGHSVMNLRRYDTICNEPGHRAFNNDRITSLLVSSMSLFFSTTLSLVLLVLREVGRHKDHEEIDIVSIVGIIISLTFAVGGFWGLVLRERAGFTRWMVGILVFGLILLVNSVLIGNIVTELKNLI